MVYEIQKNFLLSDCTLLENLKKDNIPFRNSKFETFYTQITSNHSVKFQSFCNEFYKITKFNNSILEQNQEEKISKKKFEKARKKIIGKSIKKERFEFKFCSLKSYIDIHLLCHYLNVHLYINLLEFAIDPLLLPCILHKLDLHLL